MNKKACVFSLLHSIIALSAFSACNSSPVDSCPSAYENEHIHSLVQLEEILPTCQQEGLSVIGCTYCLWELERTTLEKVPCQYENGICIWCKTSIPE